MGEKLSAAQKRALKDARDRGNAFLGIGMGSRAGGAYARMCDRLLDRGLLTANYAPTEAGRRALDAAGE
jgi:hypothetical protein